MKPILAIAIAITLLFSISCAKESHDYTALQERLSTLSLEALVEFNAQKTFVSVMDTRDGKVLAMASSSATSEEKESALEYVFEPGSVMMSITYALALESNKVTPDEVINGFKGKFPIANQHITDAVAYDFLSAQEVIVHSSNVGIAQIGMRLCAIEFYSGLQKFGFAQVSLREAEKERTGHIGSSFQLENEIYRATHAYGYGMQANLMQLMGVYSAFNNDGVKVRPILRGGETEATQVMSKKTAQDVKQALIEAVQNGTGTMAQVEGLEIGGKTGTAHMFENGKYVNRYNNTFVGFANDSANKYIIATLIVAPEKKIVAATTGAPLFRKSVAVMVDTGYLTPKKL